MVRGSIAYVQRVTPIPNTDVEVNVCSSVRTRRRRSALLTLRHSPTYRDISFYLFTIMSKRKNPSTNGNLNHDICEFLSGELTDKFLICRF